MLPLQQHIKKEDHWPSIVFSSARKDCSQVVHVVYRTHLHRLYNTEHCLEIAVTAKNIFFTDTVLV